MFPKPTPSFFFGFVLYSYSLCSDDFYQKGIEFPSLVDKCSHL